MQADPLTPRIFAFIVLTFAGLNGLATTYASIRFGAGPNFGMATLAVICLPPATLIGWRLWPVIRDMYRGTGTAARWSARASALSMSSGLAGSAIVAALLCKPDAIIDPRNDWAIYMATILLGAGLLSAFIGGVIQELAKPPV